jgi:hypothetical protein
VLTETKNLTYQNKKCNKNPGPDINIERPARCCVIHLRHHVRIKKTSNKKIFTYLDPALIGIEGNQQDQEVEKRIRKSRKPFVLVSKQKGP